MTTAAQVRAARALLDWSQADLAAKAGVSTTAINGIERGKADPRVSTLTALRRALEEAGIEFLPDEGVRRRREAATAS
jgi:transcriptional regulator with XRE-family HTH domain